MPVTGNYSVGLEATNQANVDNEEATIKIGRSLSGLFADGTAAGQANKIWQDTMPLTDGGNVSLDLAPTPASGLSGAVTFTAVKGILIWAPATNTTNITLTGTFQSGWGDPLKPGGIKFAIDPSAAGMTVTNTTKDTIIFTNGSGAAANVGVVVVGI